MENGGPATSMSWPDLSFLGITFPKGAHYTCSVGGIGPFASIDDAIGSDGLTSPFPVESWRSYSETTEFNTQ
jgi:hypothetical protein